MLLIENNDGEKTIVQVTQDIFKSMSSALEGAIQRFGK
jgi:hypothetical protein